MTAEHMCACGSEHAIVRVVSETYRPQFAHDSDVGADLRAVEDCEVWAGRHRLVRTGIKVEIPFGFFGMVVPRSGLAAKHGVTVLNSPGIIDPGYRGEVLVNLINHGMERFKVNYGDRIAQLIIMSAQSTGFAVADQLSDSERGVNGHGSTGVQ